ncbi:hypothetical protein AVEN_77629-1 [Araneus ventricosus]|uniref:Uncharacterized protein n=1 Tax=Araneus ventricosus TaxID=182803 RepID=A0A4Y2IH79_ARAVE|nr:hypothetical protein AVEN_77629-1 [Araneus ventricosus]
MDIHDHSIPLKPKNSPLLLQNTPIPYCTYFSRLQNGSPICSDFPRCARGPLLPHVSTPVAFQHLRPSSPHDFHKLDFQTFNRITQILIRFSHWGSATEFAWRGVTVNAQLYSVITR